MIKRINNFLYVLVIVFTLFPSLIKADIGPKPSITVYIEQEGEYYVTLLSKSDNYGPWSNDYSDSFKSNDDNEIKAFNAFKEFEDEDNYYFLNYLMDKNDDGSYVWGYYPPSEYKVLIYDLSNEQVYVSEARERVEFDTVLSVSIEKDTLKVTKTSNIIPSLIKFIRRLIVTIILELIIAYIFKINKEGLKLILIANIITQLLLNLVLMFFDYIFGLNYFFYLLYFIPLEIIVFLIEAKIYKRYPEKINKPYLYSFCANLASFLLGLVIIYYFG